MNIEYLEWQIERLKDSVQTAIDTGLAALAVRVGLLEQWWDYLVWRYGVETVIEDGDGSTYAKKFTDTIKNGGETVATCVCTKAMTGTQFVSVYTIGETVRTYTETKDEAGKWEGVWS